MTERRKVLAGGIIGAFVFAVLLGSPANAQQIERDYYTPQFYLDYLVFYDPAGQPIYYEGDTPYSVPVNDPARAQLMEHYRQHATEYLRWFEEVGYANLNYRRPVAADGYEPRYYQDYPVFYNDSGQPIYYADGVEQPVPQTAPEYQNYVVYYNTHRPQYLRWFQLRGSTFRSYRRPIVSAGFSPMYYDGYVVYYDGAGVPFYYLNGQMVYVPRTYPRFNEYAKHYRVHRGGYDGWYRRDGARYRTYRQPGVFRERVVVTTAPPAMRGRAAERRFYVNHGAPPPVVNEQRMPPGQRGRFGRGDIDCNRFPNHPACRQPGVHVAPAAPQPSTNEGWHRGGGGRYHGGERTPPPPQRNR